ncbi:MAG: flagellar filament capping protein FliD [Chloroflexota bacterium]
MATISSVSPTSAAWVDQLVQLSLAREQQSITRLQSQKDTLEIRQGIYDDISTKINAVLSSIETLKGYNNVFGSKSISLANADPDVKVASVSTNGTSAVAGEYSLKVTQLAQSHQISSARQAQSNVALNMSGTFLIGGVASRSVTNNAPAHAVVTGFGTSATFQENETELGSDTYSIEFRQNEGVWQFRLVDSNGDAVRIDDADDSDAAMTSNWQDFSLVKNTTFDTGRGLTITFANTDPTQQQLFGDVGIANVTYAAQGATITVETTDSLNDIRDKINQATYADGNQVQATVVDKRLVLTGSSTGSNAAIKLADTSGTILQDLKILADAGGTLYDDVDHKAELRAAQDAEFSVNTIDITRSRNKALTDVIQGLSIDLTAEGDATLTVANDNQGIIDTVKDLLSDVNELMSFIKKKTEAVKGADDDQGNPTYKPAALGQDWSMRSLRQQIAADLLGSYSEAVGNAPKYLSSIGIGLDDDGLFQLEDVSAMTEALEVNFSDVDNLFDNILGKLETRLEGYVDGSDSIITAKKSSLEDEIGQLDGRIDGYERVMSMREKALRTQYEAIQAQIIGMTYNYQSTMSLLGSYYNQQS